jgi:alpha-N-arabinofuranosidase
VAVESFESSGEPNQRVRLRHRPVSADGLFLQVEGERGWRTWTPLERFDDAGREAAVYVLDAEHGEVTFGDGERGSVPPTGARIQATYRYHAGYAAS